MDTIVADYGLLETDIIFVEIINKGDWLFEFNLDDPKYFDNSHDVSKKNILSYWNYWEEMNNQAYTAENLNCLPGQEYSKIKSILCEICPHKNLEQIPIPIPTPKLTPKSTPIKPQEIPPLDPEKPTQNSANKFRKNKPSGLQNIGNTCYISSSIQCLKHTLNLWEYFIEGKYESDINNHYSGEIAQSFGKLLHALREDNSCVSPCQFKKVVDSQTKQFNGIHQCDSHEFLIFLIDKLHEELKKVNPALVPTSDKTYSDVLSSESKIKDIFFGSFKSTIECLKCNHISINTEPFMCISLPIDPPIEEIPIILHTQSQHLFSLICKFDDESLMLGNLKNEIERQMIVSNLDFFKYDGNGNLDALPDNLIVSQLLRDDKNWEVFCIEHPGPGQSLVKISTLKSAKNILICARSDLADIDSIIQKFLAGPGKENSSTNNYILGKPIEQDNGKFKYFQVELKILNKSAEVINGIPQKTIELIKHNGDYSNLNSCLKNFTSVEKLHGVNQWVCDKCDEFTDAKKIVAYASLPKILIVHMKRFKMLRKRNRIKISKLVTFPLILLLEGENKQTHMYHLYAVVNHIGDIEGGHYTASCRNLKDRNEWFLFDDNKVTETEASQLDTNKAYVLFYEHA